MELHVMKATTLAVVFSAIIPAARGATTCCTRCGQFTATQQICRPVYAMKAEEVTCWDVACDDVCTLPNPKMHPRYWAGAIWCNLVCGHRRTIGQHSCTHCQMARGRKRLLRKTSLRPVPVVECLVEELCHDCLQTPHGTIELP
jgi:hypothetical protein